MPACLLEGLTSAQRSLIVLPVSELQPGASTSDLGVVDPLEIPGAAPVGRLWSGLPALGRSFVALVALDIVVRALGLLGTSLYIELTAPLTWITAFLPHDALILLPAVILARRPSAAIDAPLVLRGAVTVALIEALKDPVRGLAFVLAAAVSAVSAILTPNLDLGGDVETFLARSTSTVVALSGLGLAYLGWVIVRGTDDSRRPARATKLATVSMTALALGAALTLVAGEGPLWLWVFVVTFVGGYTGLVVAFGLGLADPSGTIERVVPTDDAAPEPPGPA
jgi:hypothetical protein